MSTLYTSVKMILLVTIVAGIMSLVRFVLTEYDSYLWLNWNLFLGLLPLLFAWLVTISKRFWLSSILVILWLGFLPNAPYLVTDFIHMADIGPQSLLWYDAMMIFMYTVAGIASWIVSVQVLQSKFTWPSWVVWLIAFLTGFGIYIGRYIRFNTWDIVTNPSAIFETIGVIITQPKNHEPVIGMTVVFTVILVTLYFGFTSLSYNEQTKN
jgi:uncharacterized membrane protein